jgi:hypothetical protein
MGQEGNNFYSILNHSAERNLFFQTFTGFRLSQRFIVDDYPALAYLHHAEVGCVSDTTSYTWTG